MPFLVLRATATLQLIANNVAALNNALVAAGVTVGTFTLVINQTISLASLANILTIMTGTLIVNGAIASRAAFDTLLTQVTAFKQANPSVTIELVYQEQA